MSSWVEDFIKRKGELTAKLAKEQYRNEANIILFCALEGLASELFKGQETKQKFLELLVQHSRAKPKVDTVSVPLLIWKLHEMDTRLATDISKKYKYDQNRNYTGEEIDKPSEELVKAFPDIPDKLIQKCSYACLLYKNFRCGLIHCYKIGEDGSEISFHKRDIPVCYTNEFINLEAHKDPSGRDIKNRRKKLIHFSTSYISSLLTELDSCTLKTIEKGEKLTPREWWYKTK